VHVSIKKLSLSATGLDFANFVVHLLPITIPILCAESIADTNTDTFNVVSASLHRAKRYWYGTFVIAICLSAHVSSGDMADWIGMPFGVVSGVGLGMGVLDFRGDRQRGRGSLG